MVWGGTFSCIFCSVYSCSLIVVCWLDGRQCTDPDCQGIWIMSGEKNYRHLNSIERLSFEYVFCCYSVTATGWVIAWCNVEVQRLSLLIGVEGYLAWHEAPSARERPAPDASLSLAARGDSTFKHHEININSRRWTSPTAVHIIHRRGFVLH